ncbi:DUF1302 family protein [Algiphilus sp.]|uniref:DUF1302 domain-containing protein n=2 Tax=Bacteria TaxID=2 RepID=UPI002A5BDD5D|nr:DUF1302 domain-containing protein [Pseudomonadota bacterium]
MSASVTGVRAVICRLGALALVVGASSPAAAIEMPIGDYTEISLSNLFTVGARWRTQDRDPSLVSKSTLNPGICVTRTQGEFDSPDRMFMGDTCSSLVDDPQFGDANQRYVTEPGGFGPNADNGNTNFDKGDIVNAAAKLQTDIRFSLPVAGIDFDFFARTLVLFDHTYVDLDETNFDTTHLPRRTPLPNASKSRIGTSAQLLDGFVTFDLPFIGDRFLTMKVGRQVINWGESAFLVSNSLNFINPPNQALLRVPGFDIAELLRPQGMVQLQTRLFGDLSLEAFYQYEHRPVVVDPVGSFFSTSDIVGDGGQGAMLAFGKAPEDPLQLYEPYRNPDDPAAIAGSTSSRFVPRDYAEENAREPDDGGQYGFALRQYFPDLIGGTEIGLYFSNYHSRFPLVSARAADATCVGEPAEGAVLAQILNGLAEAPIIGDLPTAPLTNIASLVASCQVPVSNLAAAAGIGDFQPAGRESLPLDSARVFLEYPEDIKLYGISFNTNIFGTAFSGEYAYRPRLPTQIHSTDLIFAALQPAFPEEDFELGIATLPGRRTAVPDFISQYRGEPIEANQYVRGYEYLKTGQLNLNFIRFVGGSGNPIGATQVTLLLEVGLQHVIDMPGLEELQFNGGQADTHVSHGADGSRGIQPADQRPEDPGDPNNPDDFDRRGRQNPTAIADLDTFGTDISYGYRAVIQPRYDNLFLGMNVSPLIAFFHDVEGTTPGIGGNFIEGRRQVIAGLSFDYLNAFEANVRYTWFTGGGSRDLQRDRDNIQFFVGYEF